MEDLFQHIIPVNEGYDYLFSDLVYVPIYETSLLVTQYTAKYLRITMQLNSNIRCIEITKGINISNKHSNI